VDPSQRTSNLLEPIARSNLPCRVCLAKRLRFPYCMAVIWLLPHGGCDFGAVNGRQREDDAEAGGGRGLSHWPDKPKLHRYAGEVVGIDVMVFEDGSQ
jgi:hypothetical protein